MCEMTWSKVCLDDAVGKCFDSWTLSFAAAAAAAGTNVLKPYTVYRCRDGQVGTLVLRNMKHLASAELYQSLLEGESNFDLPKSWSVNVKEAPTLATATL